MLATAHGQGMSSPAFHGFSATFVQTRSGTDLAESAADGLPCSHSVLPLLAPAVAHVQGGILSGGRALLRGAVEASVLSPNCRPLHIIQHACCHLQGNSVRDSKLAYPMILHTACMDCAVNAHKPLLCRPSWATTASHHCRSAWPSIRSYSCSQTCYIKFGGRKRSRWTSCTPPALGTGSLEASSALLLWVDLMHWPHVMRPALSPQLFQISFSFSSNRLADRAVIIPRMIWSSMQSCSFSIMFVDLQDNCGPDHWHLAGHRCKRPAAV